MRDFDPDGTRLPIKLDATSNGEFAPIPLEPAARAANRLAQAAASDNARRRGVSRRAFMVSSCGAASTLLAFNAANVASGQIGGYYAVAPEAAVDPALAAAALDGNELILDVQGHFVGRHGRGKVGLGGVDQFVQDVFLDSDTDMMVLSFIPSRRDPELLEIEEADAARRIVERLEGDHRLLLHGRVNPNQPGDLESMDELAQRWGVAAWKTYTQWGPDGRGFFLDDDTGERLIDRARALGVRNIAVHKGLPFGRQSYEHSLCRDIGVVAKRHPDVNFLVYHSGFVPGRAEGPYRPDAREGVDGLIASLQENGVGPNANVWADLGSTWRYVMRDPDSAAHLIGKLLDHVGEDRVLWGSDSIWYGSPQDQIQAFRAFRISEALRERHGYRQLTPGIRAKVFGLNATRVYGIDAAEARRRARGDAVSEQRVAAREAPNPHFLTYGPRTRREFLALWRANGGRPG